MAETGQTEILYHVNESLKQQQKIITAIQTDLHKVRVDLEVLKVNSGSLPVRESIGNKERVVTATAGGGIGAILVGIMTFILEYFKTKA